MIDTPVNFGSKVACSLCLSSQSTQSHILECLFIKHKCPEVFENSDISEYRKNATTVSPL